MKTAAKRKRLVAPRTLSRRILPFFWLVFAAVQLLFCAAIAPAKPLPDVENRAWKIFTSAAQTHQPIGPQVTEAQRERAPPQVKEASDELLGPETQTVFDVTAQLSQHLDSAIEMFNTEGFTANQAAALEENPGLAAAFRGTQIDTYFKQFVTDDPELQDLVVTPRFKFGPDVFNPETQQWWDVTTPAQWSKHVDKYSLFGDGTPLFTK